MFSQYDPLKCGAVRKDTSGWCLICSVLKGTWTLRMKSNFDLSRFQLSSQLMDLRALRKSQWLVTYPCSIYFCRMGNDFFQFSSLNGLIQSWVNMSKTTLASLGSDKSCISTSAVIRPFYLLTFKRHSHIQFLCSPLYVNPEWLWLSAGCCRYKATLCLGISADVLLPTFPGDLK